MNDEPLDPVLDATVGEWQLGSGPEPAVVRLTVVSSGGNRTTVAEAEAAPGEYKLVRCDDSAD